MGIVLPGKLKAKSCRFRPVYTLALRWKADIQRIGWDRPILKIQMSAKNGNICHKYELTWIDAGDVEVEVVAWRNHHCVPRWMRE